MQGFDPGTNHPLLNRTLLRTGKSTGKSALRSPFFTGSESGPLKAKLAIEEFDQIFNQERGSQVPKLLASSTEFV